MSSQVVTFYEDKEMTKAILPRTKVSAISDDSGNALSEMVLYHGDGIDSDRVLIDADLLQGHNASYFTSKSEFDTKVEELNIAIANSGLKMDLLWTNASPTSNFAPQTISLDLEKYNGIIIEAIENIHNPIYVNFFFVLKTEKNVMLTDCTDVNRWRVITSISDNSLVFSGGSTPSGANYDLIVPYRIYGVK